MALNRQISQSTGEAAPLRLTVNQATSQPDEIAYTPLNIKVIANFYVDMSPTTA